MISDRLCQACEHFSPAYTCIEKPTWGYCMRLTKDRARREFSSVRPPFTWADNKCEQFQQRGQPSACRRQ